ncbi:MAG: molybdopterin molybdotransferase MoeA [Planctomycetes bacterium]|nr:molybdopterin molybdotransferase MoeA [Planctomycetota bacterium]
MQGFASRHDVADVVRLLDERLAPLASEIIPVTECAGRVLAAEVAAQADVPGFDRAAMDGYALRGEETFGATALAPLSFRVIGEARPGRSSRGEVRSGEAVRIMTGAPLPRGADAVLMAERAAEQGGSVLALEAVAPGKNVGRKGDDIRAGAVLLQAGRLLRPQDAGLLASAGTAAVPVVRRPAVSIVITGDELLPPGERPRDACIVDSNSLMIEALARRDGGLPATAPIVPDKREALARALAGATGDVILVSGASSVGAEDHAPDLVAELGVLEVHGVAMRPAGPSGVGFFGKRPVFLLPGNPVSCLCAYEFFAGPAVRRLGGRPLHWPHRRAVLPVGRKIVSAVGRVDYVRVRIAGGKVEPIGISGASLLSSTTCADGVVIVPKESEGYGAGESVEMLLYDG